MISNTEIRVQRHQGLYDANCSALTLLWKRNPFLLASCTMSLTFAVLILATQNRLFTWLTVFGVEVEAALNGTL